MRICHDPFFQEPGITVHRPPQPPISSSSAPLVEGQAGVQAGGGQASQGLSEMLSLEQWAARAVEDAEAAEAAAVR